MSGEAKVVSTIFTCFLILVVINYSQPTEPEPVVYETYLETQFREVQVSEDIIDVTSVYVQPILYGGAKDLRSLPLNQEKKRFISLMLPAILVAKYHIQKDLDRIDELSQSLVWSAEDSSFFEKTSIKYKTDKIPELRLRLRTHPNSIVLAQAAVESGWGKSRFFKEANNVFGVWSYNANEPRIPAGIRRSGYQVYLKLYHDISESVESYFLTLARAGAYKTFRQKRAETDNIFELLPLLKNYSERKEAYILQLEGMIRYNKFQQYDTFQIDPNYLVQRPVE